MIHCVCDLDEIFISYFVLCCWKCRSFEADFLGFVGRISVFIFDFIIIGEEGMAGLGFGWSLPCIKFYSFFFYCLIIDINGGRNYCFGRLLRNIFDGFLGYCRSLVKLLGMIFVIRPCLVLFFAASYIYYAYYIFYIYIYKICMFCFGFYFINS